MTKLIKWISVGTNNLKKVFLSLTKSILQFTKYNLIGAFRSAFTFSFYAVLVTFGLHPVLALTLTFLISAPATILLHRKYVFQHSLPIRKVLPSYLLLYLSMFFLNSIMLLILVEFFLLDGIWAQVFCIGIITILNFLFLSKYFKTSNQVYEKGHESYEN